MTRKDFIDLAQRTKEEREGVFPTQLVHIDSYIHHVLIPFLRTQNSNFNESRFLTACGFN
jgi:hypothetical protein